MSLTPEQLQIRRTGIGASEIGAILGYSPFKSALDVFLNKRPGFEEDAPRANLAQSTGHEWEGAVAQIAANRCGWKLRAAPTTYRDARRPWMLATPDRWRVEGRKRVGVIEVKTSHDESFVPGFGSFGPDGTDRVPPLYRCQVQWQMMVCKVREAHLPVFLFGERELRVYPLAHNAELADALEEAGRKFWHEHVLTGEPPEHGETGSDVRRYLAGLFRVCNGETITAPGEAAPWAAQLATAKAAIKAAEVDEEQATNYLKAIVGENRGMEGPWGRFLWFAVESRGTDWKGLAEVAMAGMDPGERGALLERFKQPGGRSTRFSSRFSSRKD